MSCIEFYLTKTTSQWTQLFGVKLKKQPTDVLKLNSIWYVYAFPALLFMNILIGYLLTQFFYNQNQKTCLIKQILYQYLLFLLPCLGQLLLRKHFICQYILLSEKHIKCDKCITENISALEKLRRFFRLLMKMCLRKFDLYRGTLAPYCFKNHSDFRCFDFFKKEKRFV